MTQAKYMRPGLDFAVGKAIEECGELCAALGKTLRWGWDSYNPELPPREQESNRDWVLRELLDLSGAIVNLENEIAKARSAPTPEPVREGVASEFPRTRWESVAGHWMTKAHELQNELLALRAAPQPPASPSQEAIEAGVAAWPTAESYDESVAVKEILDAAKPSLHREWLEKIMQDDSDLPSRFAPSPSQEGGMREEAKRIINAYWDADQEADAHRTICELHNLVSPESPCDVVSGLNKEGGMREALREAAIDAGVDVWSDYPEWREWPVARMYREKMRKAVDAALAHDGGRVTEG